MHEPVTLPWALNGLGLWVALMIALTITNYGYPVIQLMRMPEANVPPVFVGGKP